MNIKGTNHYKRAGCDFRGNLLVASYEDDIKNTYAPDWKNFDLQCYYDYADKALALIKQITLNKQICIRLTAPDLVVEIK
jgi:hypothetical protein